MNHWVNVLIEAATVATNHTSSGRVVLSHGVIFAPGGRLAMSEELLVSEMCFLGEWFSWHFRGRGHGCC